MPYCTKCGAVETDGQKFCNVCGTARLNVYADHMPLPHGIDVTSFSPSAVRLAGFWTRVLGFILDQILLFLAVSLPLRLFNTTFGANLATTIVVNFFYGWLFIGSSSGQTPGMRVVAIRCVDQDRISALGLRRSAVRSACYTVLLAIGSVYQLHPHTNPTQAQRLQDGKDGLLFLVLFAPHLLDLLWVAWDQRNQALHDKVAHSVVIVSKRSATS